MAGKARAVPELPFLCPSYTPGMGCSGSGKCSSTQGAHPIWGHPETAQSLPVPPTSPVLPPAPRDAETQPCHPSMIRGDSPVTTAQDEVGHWGQCPRWVTQQPGRPCQLKMHLQHENCMSSLHPFLITPHPAQNPAPCHTRSSWHPCGPPSELPHPTACSLRQRG